MLEARYLADVRPMSRYRFIAVECECFLMRRLCPVLRVPASGYYT